jgi:hypothetical protein
LVFFENTVCLRCGQSLGFDPDGLALVAVSEADQARRCANQVVAECNWLVPETTTDRGDPLCRSCRLTRTRPSDTDQVAMAGFADAESAKRRLVFQLLDLGLPLDSYLDRPGGLAYDLLSSNDQAVTTGHEDGIVTIDLAESDDPHREQVRQELGEPYRTMLGHLRHETGHYYWDILVERAGRSEGFRTLFGDERADYGEALERHYAKGAPAGWDQDHVSAYATMHPWEDWAETFAHYLHIRDTLQTAAAFGMRVERTEATLSAAPEIEDGPFEEALADWLPLTYALNAVNRSMGRDDLYPFVLTPPWSPSSPGSTTPPSPPQPPEPRESGNPSARVGESVRVSRGIRPRVAVLGPAVGEHAPRLGVVDERGGHRPQRWPVAPHQFDQPVLELHAHPPVQPHPGGAGPVHQHRLQPVQRLGEPGVQGRRRLALPPELQQPPTLLDGQPAEQSLGGGLLVGPHVDAGLLVVDRHVPGLHLDQVVQHQHGQHPGDVHPGGVARGQGERGQREVPGVFGTGLPPAVVQQPVDPGDRGQGVRGDQEAELAAGVGVHGEPPRQFVTASRVLAHRFVHPAHAAISSAAERAESTPPAVT